MKWVLVSITTLALVSSVDQAQKQEQLSPRTKNALVHVVAHEIGHAFLREFDLPILGPEEAIADDFATVYVYLKFPERAEEIIAARAEQNIADGEDTGRFSEYMDDDQRAGRSVCLLYGLDPARYDGLRDRFHLTEDAASNCRDFGPEVGRSWRRLIDAYKLPAGARVTEVRLTADGTPLARMITDGEFGAEINMLLSGIDWHSQITLAVEECDSETGWSRNGRKITICESYIKRFEKQLGEEARQ